MTPFAIAGIKMHVDAVESNGDAMMQRCDLLIVRFAWTQMVLFSELAPYGSLHKFAQPFPSEVEDKFQALAHRPGIWLMPSSMFEMGSDALIDNTATVINPQGDIVCRYRKLFLFRPYQAGTETGRKFCVFDVPELGRLGLSICYDIWIPETTRQLTSQGMAVLLHPVLKGSTDRQADLKQASQ